MPTRNKPLRYRPIRFHTGHIPGIGGVSIGYLRVDAEGSHVDSVASLPNATTAGRTTTRWASRTATGRPDLLGDMVRRWAADIECPIYISVQWDELSAREHPEWHASAPNRYYHALAGDPSGRI